MSTPEQAWWGQTCPWVHPLPVSSVNTGIPHAWEHYLAKASSRIQRPAVTRVMWLTQNGVFSAAPWITRTPLFRIEIHVVRSGGSGVATWTAVKWALGSVWVLYGCRDCGSDNFFKFRIFAFGKPPNTWDDSLVPGILIPVSVLAVPGTAELSCLCVQTCSKDRYRKQGFDPADSISQYYIWSGKNKPHILVYLC